jgi:hypothetical protein
MRIQGRVLRPSTLAERRLLFSVGVDHLRVPREINPFAVIRRLQKVAVGSKRELLAIRALACVPCKKRRIEVSPVLANEQGSDS